MGPAVVQQLRSRLAGQPGGQTLLEFALVAPLMLFFVLALVDFGIAIDRRLVLDHAVREGARFASVGAGALGEPPGSSDAVRYYTYDQAQTLPDSVSAIEVSYRCIGTQQAVQVSIDYDYEFITPIGLIASLGPSIRLSAEASARVERSLADADPPEDCLLDE